MRWRTYAALQAEAAALELPPEAWFGAKHNIALGVRRDPMGASKRRWWPGRSAAGRCGKMIGDQGVKT
jgi:hypothetical protein